MTKNIKIEQALERLEGLLPLKQNQSSLDDDLFHLHRELLRSFVKQGRILNRQEIYGLVKDVDDAIRALQTNELLVMSDAGDLLGAYPFTMEAREHQIHINGHIVHAMCALDSLAASAMFGMPAEVKSQCCISGELLQIHQSKIGGIESVSKDDIYFVIDWGRYDASTGCADSLCLQMSFVVGKNRADQWLKRDSVSRQIFVLTDAAEFSARFFVPLMN